MTDDPIQASIDRIGQKGDHFDLKLGKQDGELAAGVEAVKDFGKPGGWSAGAAWEWMRGKGSSWFAGLSWRPGGRK